MIKGEKGLTVEEGYTEEDEIERERRREIKRGNRRGKNIEDERTDKREEEGVNSLEGE